MILNLIGLLILVALVVLFGWLTWRAARAKSWFVKIPGVLLAGLLTLVLALIVFVAGKGMLLVYAPPSDPAPNLKVEGTPEQIARGKYIAYIGCAGCHGVKGEFPLTGGLDIANDIPMPIGALVAVNITPGGVLKDRTDGELFRVLRHGIAQDHKLSVMMALMPFRQLSDEDTKAVIAFLRSQAPVESPTRGGDDVNLLGMALFGAGMFPEPDPINRNAITAPARGINAEYGKYVATFGECRGCHGPDMTGTPPSAADPIGVPNPRPMVATWSREQFIQTMRTGVRPSGVKFQDRMPWTNASRMSEEDLSALYEYVKTK
jgi:mono/diheme cytochrome c family protein